MSCSLIFWLVGTLTDMMARLGGGQAKGMGFVCGDVASVVVKVARGSSWLD